MLGNGLIRKGGGCGELANKLRRKSSWTVCIGDLPRRSHATKQAYLGVELLIEVSGRTPSGRDDSSFAQRRDFKLRAEAPLFKKLHYCLDDALERRIR